MIEDHCVHGGGSLGPAIKQFTTDAKAKPDEINVTATNGDVDMANGDNETIMVWSDHGIPTDAGSTPFPEGRVHGSGLLALLSGRSHAGASSSENGASTSASMRSWM